MAATNSTEWDHLNPETTIPPQAAKPTTKSAQLAPKSLLLILALIILGYKYNTLDYILSHVTQPLNSPQAPISQSKPDTVDTSIKVARSNTATMAWAAAVIVGAIGYGSVMFRLARENIMRKEMERKVAEDEKRERREEVRRMEERLRRLEKR